MLAQDYPNLLEVILVGSVGDTTWRGVEGIHDPRLITMEQPPIAGRDPNLKRDAGIKKASGDLIGMADSDIMMPSGWLSRGVALLAEQGVECVAGGMKSIHASFWGRYVDTNLLAAKTPRNESTYLVIRRYFGSHGAKPPITANVLFTRKLYAACPLDINWIYGYEDYEWFWRIASAGYPVLFSHELDGLHHHRRGLRPLAREYLRSSGGCAMLIRAHPDCPLARKRRRQAVLLPAAAAAVAGLAAGLTAAGSAGLVLAAGGATLLLSSAREYARTRRLESIAYPAVSAVLGGVYVTGLLRGLLAGRAR